MQLNNLILCLKQNDVYIFSYMCLEKLWGIQGEVSGYTEGSLFCHLLWGAVHFEDHHAHPSDKEK